MRFRTSIALTTGLVLGGYSAAAAVPAVTSANTNVRSGPGVRYSVVSNLPAGAQIEVIGCTGNWCQTPYGYVSARLVRQGAPIAPVAAGAYGGAAYSNRAAATAGMPSSGAAAAYAAPIYRTTPAASGAGGLAVAPGSAGGPTGTATGPLPPTATLDLNTNPENSALGNVHPGQNDNMAGARTTIGTANVRSGPGTDFDVVETLPDATKVEVKGCSNGWCQTDQGYISLYLLSRGPVQQVLTPAAEPRIPGSETRDSINYYGTAPVGARAGNAFAAGNAVVPGGVPMTAGGGALTAPGATAPAYALRAGGNAVPGAYVQGAGGAGVVGITAGNASVTANAKVRSGPGMGYPVLGTLPRGYAVNVESCAGSWCRTQYGYVSARLVSRGAYAPAPFRNATPYRGASMAQVYGVPAQSVPAYAAPAYASPVAVAPTYRTTPAASGAGGLAVAPGSAGGPTGTATGPLPPTVTLDLNTNPENSALGNVHPGQNDNMAGARTTIGTANVRSGPGTDFDVVETLPDATKVEVKGCSNGWCQTDQGYISLYLLSRGPVQQVLTPAAEPRIPGSETRDSINYYGTAPVGARAGNAVVPGGVPMTAGGGALTAPGATAPAYALRAGGIAVPGADPTIGRAYAPSVTGGVGTAAGNATVTGTANVRSGPGGRYPVLGTLPRGYAVNVDSCTGSWCRTQYGYVSARLVARGIYSNAAVTPSNFRRATRPAGNVPFNAPYAAQPAAIDPRSAYGSSGQAATVTTALNLRSGPGVAYPVIGTLPAGTAVNVTGCTGAWCQTQYGYVSSRYLSGAGVPQAYNTPMTRSAYPATTYGAPTLAASSYGGSGTGSFYPGPGYASFPSAGIPGATYQTYNNGLTPAYYDGPTVGTVLTDLAAPVTTLIGAVTGAGQQSSWNRTYGTGWRASWGPVYSNPGYWGPGLGGRNIPSSWGARPSYWGGRPTYWSMHPGYPAYGRFGDRKGGTYWSPPGGGRRPQTAAWYYGYDARRGQGPYQLATFTNRPLLWQPGAGIW